MFYPVCKALQTHSIYTSERLYDRIFSKQNRIRDPIQNTPSNCTSPLYPRSAIASTFECFLCLYNFTVITCEYRRMITWFVSWFSPRFSENRISLCTNEARIPRNLFTCVAWALHAEVLMIRCLLIGHIRGDKTRQTNQDGPVHYPIQIVLEYL